MARPPWQVVAVVAVGFPLTAIGAHVAHELTHYIAARAVRARVVSVRVGLLRGHVEFEVEGRLPRARAIVVNLSPTVVAAGVVLAAVAAGWARLSVQWAVVVAWVVLYGTPSREDVVGPAPGVRERLAAAERWVRAAGAALAPQWPVPRGFWVAMALLYLSWGLFLASEGTPYRVEPVMENVAGGLAVAGAIKGALVMHRSDDWSGGDV